MVSANLGVMILSMVVGSLARLRKDTRSPCYRSPQSLPKEPSSLHDDSHGGEHDGKVVLMVVEYGLAWEPGQNRPVGNLSGERRYEETGGREDRDLLPSGDKVHGVDSGSQSGPSPRVDTRRVTG